RGGSSSDASRRGLRPARRQPIDGIPSHPGRQLPVAGPLRRSRHPNPDRRSTAHAPSGRTDADRDRGSGAARGGRRLMQRGFARRRGNTWTAYYHVVRDGARRQHTKGGFRTKAAAEAFLNETVAKLQINDFVEPSRMTLGEYLMEYWLPIAQNSLRPATVDAYRRNIERHVMPILGEVRLQKLSAH